MQKTGHCVLTDDAALASCAGARAVSTPHELSALWLTQLIRHCWLLLLSGCPGTLDNSSSHSCEAIKQVSNASQQVST